MPQALKLQILKRLIRQHRLKTLIETGTFHGDTVNALRCELDQVISIELDHGLYQAAKNRFRHDPRVDILQGNSAALMPLILEDLEQPCLFWLDGHYSGPGTAHTADSPLEQELLTLLPQISSETVIAIDDSRFCGRYPGYPDLPTIQHLVKNLTNNHHLQVLFDIIVIRKPLSPFRL